jgi:agmatinase
MSVGKPHLARPFEQLAALLTPFTKGEMTNLFGPSFFVKSQFGTSRNIEIIYERWEERLSKVAYARAVILGVPYDNGCQTQRGSAYGPSALRHYIHAVGETGGINIHKRLEKAGVIDIGDVSIFSPSLSTDDLLNRTTVRRLRKAHYSSDMDRLFPPVSPLSILERAILCIRKINPIVPIHLLGGDHSISAVPIRLLAAESPKDPKLAVVQIDAHDDMEKSSDGILHYNSWAYDAAERLGGKNRFFQIGLRTVPFSAENADLLGLQLYPVRRLRKEKEGTILDELVQRILSSGAEQVYVTNDIDGTDPRWCAATGTPETEGLTPHFISALLQRLGEEKDLNVIGSDLMEVAPNLNRHVPQEPFRTLQTASHYLVRQIEASLKTSLGLDSFFPIPTPAKKLPPLEHT